MIASSNRSRLSSRREPDEETIALDGIDEEFGDLFKRYEGRCHAPRSQASSTIDIMSTLPARLVAVSDCTTTDARTPACAPASHTRSNRS